MPKKKFELKKSANEPVDQEAHHPIASSTVAEEEEEVSRVRGTRPRFSRSIPIERIHPNPWQARQEFDQAKLEELAAGMQEHGWVGGGLPVRAHPTLTNEYQLVFGERRWRAAKLAGLTAVPCEVSTFSDDDMVEIGLIENIQRENLTNYEEGFAYQKLIDLRDDLGRQRYSIRSLARRLGKDKSYVEDRLQYARAPESVQQLAQANPDIAPRMVRELSHVEDEAVRGALIEAVQQNKVDIEDVKLVRKQLQAQSSIEEAAGVAENEREIVAPAAAPSCSLPMTALVVTPSALSEDADLWLLRTRLQKDDVRMLKLLRAWAEKPSCSDTSLEDDVRARIRGWERVIAQIKLAWSSGEVEA